LAHRSSVHHHREAKVGKWRAFTVRNHTSITLFRIEPVRYPDGEHLARELVSHSQHPELPAVAGPILDEIVGPDLVRAFRPQADARPQASQSRFRLGWRAGTFNPSRRRRERRSRPLDMAVCRATMPDATVLPGSGYRVRCHVGQWPTTAQPAANSSATLAS
jgi:hypothetical protein